MTENNRCPLCDRELGRGGAAAFRNQAAHLACWLEWREGSRPAPRPTVLVVDDDDAGRYTTSRILRSANFEVTEAPSGSAALTAVASRPDVVLLDMQLPDFDGFEICRRIKSDPRTQSVRVLPFTAVFRHEGDRRRAIQLGADGYLVRPVSAQELLATINDLIRN